MTDEQVEQTNETTDTAAAEGPKQLREALKRREAELQELRSVLLREQMMKVGLDPEKGLGKAIAKEFSGTPTAEAIVEYARQEYQWEPQEQDTSSQQSDVAPPPQAPPVPPTARLDEVASPTPVDTNAVRQRIAQAEAEGDWQLAVRLKEALVYQEHVK